MEGFDTMAMPPYLASPLSLGNLQGSDYLNAMPGLDLPDHRSNFDSETFVRYVFGGACIELSRSLFEANPRRARSLSLQ